MPWKTLEKPGLEPAAPNRLADRKHDALPTRPNLHLQKYGSLVNFRCRLSVFLCFFFYFLLLKKKLINIAYFFLRTFSLWLSSKQSSLYVKLSPCTVWAWGFWLKMNKHKPCIDTLSLYFRQILSRCTKVTFATYLKHSGQAHLILEAPTGLPIAERKGGSSEDCAKDCAWR